MDAQAYRIAIASIGLSQLAAGRWLGVSPKTAQRYATEGPTGPAARAVGMAVALMGLERIDHDGYGGWEPDVRGYWIKQSELTAAVGLP